MKMADELALLRRTGADVELLDSGCCGMAGPFGFEREKIRGLAGACRTRTAAAVRAAACETILVADGFSCREQISQNTSSAVTLPKSSPPTRPAVDIRLYAPYGGDRAGSRPSSSSPPHHVTSVSANSAFQGKRSKYRIREEPPADSADGFSVLRQNLEGRMTEPTSISPRWMTRPGIVQDARTGQVLMLDF